ncbi:MAG: metallophosphoesterase, partial [Muribaculaceae bacterium]|nr:metallophosphoesterase [Muribaculaceae bacterium]
MGLLLYSSAVTPYQINVSNIDIEFDNLPKAFDNYKIVQFSDLHLGSYISGSTFIDELVDSIN